MDKIYDHIDLLGMRVSDKVTGIQGIVTCVSFDLYGCIQAVICPGVDGDGKLRESIWVDVSRITVLDSNRIMKIPDFHTGPVADGDRGPAEKPAGRL